MMTLSLGKCRISLPPSLCVCKAEGTILPFVRFYNNVERC